MGEDLNPGPHQFTHISAAAYNYQWEFARIFKLCKSTNLENA